MFARSHAQPLANRHSERSRSASRTCAQQDPQDQSRGANRHLQMKPNTKTTNHKNTHTRTHARKHTAVRSRKPMLKTRAMLSSMQIAPVSERTRPFLQDRQLWSTWMAGKKCASSQQPQEYDRRACSRLCPAHLARRKLFFSVG